MKLIIKQRGNLYSLMLYIDNGGPYHIIFYSVTDPIALSLKG